MNQKRIKKIIGTKLQHRTTNDICTVIEIDENGAKVQYEEDSTGNVEIKYYTNNSLNSKFSLYEENSDSIQKNILNNKDNSVKETLSQYERLSRENERLSQENERLSKENERLSEDNKILKNKILELKSALDKKHRAGKVSKFENEDINKMLEYHNQGESYRSIAKKFECSSAYIHKIIKNIQNKVPNEDI